MRPSLVGLNRWMIDVCSLLALSTPPCFGQHTVVRDAGGARKIELVYNASEQLVETRTLDASGKLQGSVEHEYRPGFLTPQETTTSYWPDGKAIRSVARVTYDENGNFTGEAISLFNESGTQIGGSTLAHDPFTGIYRCSKWDPSVQAHQPAKCPKSEESVEGAKQAKELTQDEVTKQVELARQAQLEARRVQSSTPAQQSLTKVMKEIAVILPAHLRPGDRVSASIIAVPERYEGIQGLTVIRTGLQAESRGDTLDLSGWVLEIAGSEPQRSGGRVSFAVPRANEFGVTLRMGRDPARSISRTVTIAQNSQPQNPSSSKVFEAAALCLKGDICPIRGPFSGDSSKTLIAFDSMPAPIVAETEGTAYISVPGRVPPGLTHLIVAEGSQVAVLPVIVAEVAFSPTQRKLAKGDTLVVHATLSGPEELADDQWRAGIFPGAGTFERARELDAAFEQPHDGSEGIIEFVIRNATPEPVSLRGSKSQAFVFKLTPDSFENGEFKYQFVVEATQTGEFELRGTVLPFVESARGQQLQIKAGALEK